MKKFILPIFFIFLFITTSASVFAKDPECWTKHMVRQMSDCSKAFLACNNPCGAILDESTRYGCFDSCSKASTLCREKASADYRVCIAAGKQTQTQQEAKKVTDDTAAYVTDKLAQYRLAVEDEAKKIVSIKECGEGPPSQNACVAEKLSDIYSINATYRNFTPTNLINVEPVPLDNRKEIEIVRFGNSIWQYPNIDAVFKTNLPHPEDTSLQSGIKEFPFFKGELIDVYIPSSQQWKQVTVGTPLPPGTLLVVDHKPVMLYSQLNVAEMDQPSFIKLMGSPSDSASTQAESDNLFYDLKSGSAVFDTSESGKNIEVRTPLTITKSKHTKFAVLYNPEKLYAATIIYDGEVEVTDILSNKTMILKPSDKGKQRMVIVPLAQAEEKTQTAGPASEAESKPSAQSKSSGNIWILIFILILVIIAVGGFVLYKKGVLKKDLIKEDILKRFFPPGVDEQKKR